MQSTFHTIFEESMIDVIIISVLISSKLSNTDDLVWVSRNLNPFSDIKLDRKIFELDKFCTKIGVK